MQLSRDQLRQAIREVLTSHPEIVFAYLFGSMAEAESFRDIDIAIYVRESKRREDVLGYTISLSVELERRTGYPADVIFMNTAPDHLIHAISKGEAVLNRDDDARIDFITSAWMRYFDVKEKRREAIADMVA